MGPREPACFREQTRTERRLSLAQLSVAGGNHDQVDVPPLRGLDQHLPVVVNGGARSVLFIVDAQLLLQLGVSERVAESEVNLLRLRREQLLELNLDFIISRLLTIGPDHFFTYI